MAMHRACNAALVKDSFINDFLFDTEQIESMDLNSRMFSELNFLSSDDTSLTSYLSGETEIDSRKDEASGDGTSRDKSSLQLSPKSCSSVNDFDVESIDTHRPIIVVTKPAMTGTSKGSSSTRQAVAARENRQKKKQYLAGLEASVKRLAEENEELKNQDIKQKRQIKNLQTEVRYLRNVISNESALSALLKNIHNTEGVKLSAPILTEVENNCHMETTVSDKKRKQVSGCQNDDSFEVTSSQEIEGHCPKRTCPQPPKVAQGTRHLPTMTRKSSNISQMEDIISAKEKHGDSNISSELNLNAVEIFHETPDITATDGGPNDNEGLGGVCLHVLGKSVSVEFCASCNSKALKSKLIDHEYSKK